MSPTLSIVSPGLLDPQALSLMGASTKRDDPTQIGRFGSGLKYALAYLLRNDYTLAVHIGPRKVRITTEEVDLRGNKFQRILIDGQPTSLTTALGPDWKLWQAIRELYCNALDEGAQAPLTFGPIAPGTACTTFRLTGPGLEEIYNARETYFSTNPARALFTSPTVGRILRKVDDNQRIYRKGILAKVQGTSSAGKSYAFDYDLYDIKLNEDRSPESDWDVNWEIARLIAQCTVPSIIATLSAIGIQDMARAFGSTSGGSFTWSPAWHEFLAERPLACPMLLGAISSSDLARCRIVSDVVYTIACDNGLGKPFLSGKGGHSYTRVHTEPHQVAALDEAARLFTSIGMPLTHPIIVGRFVNKEIMGFAEGLGAEGTIVIAEACFFRGIQYVLETLIEEEVHLTEGCHDSTRAMQDALIRYAAKAILSR